MQWILDTVTDRLLDNPDRKFIYVETGFFERWWIQQTDEMKVGRCASWGGGARKGPVHPVLTPRAPGYAGKV